MASISFDEITIKRQIYNAMTVQMVADLTTGRKDEGLRPLADEEVKIFIKRMKGYVCETAEEDWYREFLYEGLGVRIDMGADYYTAEWIWDVIRAPSVENLLAGWLLQ